MGSKIFAFLTLVLTGAIVADVLTHPNGTHTAGSAVVAILKPSYQAASGQTIT